MSTKNLDPSFQGAGQRIGTEIWRIENSQPVPLPKSDYGKFYSEDSYIILQTSSGKGGAHLYDIHFWLGKDTSQDEAAKASIKSVELDAVIGGRAVQHRELQGFESDKFLSYFKPCIIPLEGGVASGFKNPEEKFETRLYVCKGKHTVKVKQVPFARSSLNHDDVFILDTEKKIFQFNGANSNTQERAKSLEVIRYLKDKYHEGTSDVAIVDDGKLVAESDSGEFWVLLGGYAPIGKKVASEDDAVFETTDGKLYSIREGQPKLEGGPLLKSSLENNKCFLLDCGSEVFLWVGRVTQLEERKAASQAAEEFLTSQDRPKSTRITRLIQGYESRSFKSKFESWPVGTTTTASEEGRGKVAALLKQQGVDLKGSAKSTVNEEAPPLLESGGKLEVWRINGNAKNLVSAEEMGKFYSGDCYITLYTYHSGDKKEEYFLSCWIGKDSIEDDRATATRLANTMCNSLKGRPVQGRIMQGKEPPQFIALFQPMVVLKGGISSGYKKYVADNKVNDETYTSEGIALIQISNTSIYNNKAIQVDALATSLNSYDCFLLQSGATFYTWHGTNSTYEQQHWAEKVAEFLRPGIALKHAKEGTETSAFWFALNGKQNFTSKKLHQESVRDPHLYILSFNKGKLEVSEIHNFSQDDLLTEDILILDTHSEVFIWIGYSVDSKVKQNAFDLGQKYIEHAVAIDGLSPEVPLYKITEGNEPSFFTTYFSWDNAKAVVFANSYAKKLSLLFGTTVHGSESPDRSFERSHGGPTQRASAMAALNSAFNTALREVKVDRSVERSPDGPTQRASAMAALTSAFNPTSTKSSIPKPPSQGSQRAAAVAALSGVLTAEKKTSETSSTRFSRSPSPERPKREDAVSEGGDAVEEASSQTETTSQKEETIEADAVSESNDNIPEVSVGEQQTEEDDDDGCQRTFSYERLRAKSTDPVKGIDYKRRETYLSDSEFQTVFGMPKDAFYRQPKWKQDMQKRKADMF